MTHTNYPSKEIAYSSRALDTLEVPNGAFRYAKPVTLPFFGSGLVEIPPGGIKRPKNSRSMQMVFFVFSGKVLVDISGNKFRIGKGGMWQVPRGESIFLEVNFYLPPISFGVGFMVICFVSPCARFLFRLCIRFRRVTSTILVPDGDLVRCE